MAGEDNIKQLEKQLADVQAQLAEARKQAAASAARQKVLDTIQTQRAVAQTAVTAADTAQGQWEALIAGKLPQQERDDLKGKIDDAMQEVTDAKTQVTTLIGTVATDETDLATAEDTLKAQEGAYEEKQKQLGQLAAAIKDAQKEVDQLRGETLAAVNAEAWRRAYYKNYRLDQAISAAMQLLDPAQAQKDLLDALTALEGEIKTQQAAAVTARQKLDKDKADQKMAAQDYAEKTKGLETAIANFL